MPPARPALLRRRDRHVLWIVSAVALINLLTGVLCVLLVRHFSTSCTSQLSVASSSCDLSRSYCSSVVEYLTLLSYNTSPPSQDQPYESTQSDDDVVGVYGYGQTQSSTSTWLYRDDRLRDGRSRRVYLRRIPRQ